LPQCGALSLLQKTPHYRGDTAETAARLNAKLWVLVPGRILPPFLVQSFTRNLKADAGHSRGNSWVLVCASVLRNLPPAAPPGSPVAPALASALAAPFLFLISTATAGGITAVQTVSAAAKTLPATPARESLIAARAKRNCTDRAIFTLLCCTTDELYFSCCDNRSNSQRRREDTANDPNS